jgi:hypothetical protein
MGKRSSLYKKHEVQDKSVKGSKGKFIQAYQKRQYDSCQGSKVIARQQHDKEEVPDSALK